MPKADAAQASQAFDDWNEIAAAGIPNRSTAQQAHRAVARIGDEHRIARALIEDALRFAEPVYGPQGAARREIDHTQAVVSEFGDEARPLSSRQR